MEDILELGKVLLGGDEEAIMDYLLKNIEAKCVKDYLLLAARKTRMSKEEWDLYSVRTERASMLVDEAERTNDPYHRELLRLELKELAKEKPTLNWRR